MQASGPAGGSGHHAGGAASPALGLRPPSCSPAPFPRTLVSKQHACQAALSQHVRFINYLLKSRNGTVSAATGHVCTSGGVCPAGIGVMVELDFGCAPVCAKVGFSFLSRPSCSHGVSDRCLELLI